MLKILYTGCPGPFPAISMQFTLKTCDAAGNLKKITETLILAVQTFKVIDVTTLTPIKSLSLLLQFACYDKQHVCAYLQPFSHYTSQ